MFQLEVLEGRSSPYSTLSAWTTHDLTYSYVGDAAEIASTFVRALKLWADVTPLTFREVADVGPAGGAYDNYKEPASAHIRLSRHISLPGDTVGIGQPPNLSYFFHGDLSGDIFIDDRAERTSDLLFNVLVHEIGHAIGLHHSDVRGSVMAASASFGREVVLSEDDVAGIQSLYGSGRGQVIGTQAIRPADPFPGFTGRTEEASADVNGDSVKDAIFAADTINGHVKIFDGRSGMLSMSVLAFPGFLGGIDLAASDEAVAVAANGAQGHVRVYRGEREAESFLAFPGYAGPVSVAVSDRIAVQAGNHVKEFHEGREVASFFK